MIAKILKALGLGIVKGGANNTLRLGSTLIKSLPFVITLILVLINFMPPITQSINNKDLDPVINEIVFPIWSGEQTVFEKTENVVKNGLTCNYETKTITENDSFWSRLKKKWNNFKVSFNTKFSKLWFIITCFSAIWFMIYLGRILYHILLFENDSKKLRALLLTLLILAILQSTLGLILYFEKNAGNPLPDSAWDAQKEFWLQVSPFKGIIYFFYHITDIMHYECGVGVTNWETTNSTKENISTYSNYTTVTST